MFKIDIPYKNAIILGKELEKLYGVKFIVAEVSGGTAIGEEKKLYREAKKHVVSFINGFTLGVKSSQS